MNGKIESTNNSEMSYLLDSNIVIKYLDASLTFEAMQKLNSIVDNDPIVSVITRMETLGFNCKSISEQLLYEIFINGSTVIPVNE